MTYRDDVVDLSPKPVNELTRAVAAYFYGLGYGHPQSESVCGRQSAISRGEMDAEIREVESATGLAIAIRGKP